MALRMKYWMGLVTVGAALVAIWTLPPSAAGPGRWHPSGTALDQRADALETEIRRSHEILKRMRWYDSLPALAMAGARDGLAVVLPPSNKITPELKGRFEERIREEMAGWEPRSDVVLGYVIQPRDVGAVPALVARVGGAPDAKESYVGTRDGRPFCLQIKVTRPEGWDDRLIAMLRDARSQQSNFVGLCRPYMRFGPAGPHVQAWLDEGAIGFADRYGISPATRPEFRWRMTSLRVFGAFRYGFSSRQTLSLDQCLAGDAAGCRKVMLDDLDVAAQGDGVPIERGSPATSLGSSVYSSPFGFFDDYLFDDLERDFGTEAFQRFWTSDKEVTDAFADAFGVEIGAWTVSWVDRVIGVSPAGPRLTLSAGLGGLLTVSLFAGLAVAWARRRKVA
jgi:hypothetical protein